MTKGSEGIKGHEHSASHAHSHPAHHDSEFLTQVRALKDAERSAAAQVEDADVIPELAEDDSRSPFGQAYRGHA